MDKIFFEDVGNLSMFDCLSMFNYVVEGVEGVEIEDTQRGDDRVLVSVSVDSNRYIGSYLPEEFLGEEEEIERKFNDRSSLYDHSKGSEILVKCEKEDGDLYLEFIESSGRYGEVAYDHLVGEGYDVESFYETIVVDEAIDLINEIDEVFDNVINKENSFGLQLPN